jgi:hypothetical protein
MALLAEATAQLNSAISTTREAVCTVCSAAMPSVLTEQVFRRMRYKEASLPRPLATRQPPPGCRAQTPLCALPSKRRRRLGSCRPRSHRRRQRVAPKRCSCGNVWRTSPRRSPRKPVTRGGPVVAYGLCDVSQRARAAKARRSGGGDCSTAERGDREVHAAPCRWCACARSLTGPAQSARGPAERVAARRRPAGGAGSDRHARPDAAGGRAAEGAGQPHAEAPRGSPRYRAPGRRSGPGVRGEPP